MASDVVANTDPTLIADPHLSTDEYMILLSMGKNKGFKIQADSQIRRKGQQADLRDREISVLKENAATREIGQNRRAKKTGEGIYPVGGMVLRDPGGASSPSRNIAGGFAPALLIPFIPLMSSAITGLVSIITAAINKRKGAGVLPPNLRFGRGAMPLVLGKAMKGRQGRYASIDEALSKLKGTEFWKRFVQESKKELADILPDITNVTESKAEDLATMAVNKAIPTSFQQQLAQTSGKGPAGSSSESQMSSIVKPLAKWMVSQVVEGVEDNTEVDSAINEEIAPLEQKLGGFSTGKGVRAKKFFRTVWKYGKRVAHAVLPKLIEIGKEELPEIIDAVAKKIRLPDQYKEPMAKFAKEHAPKLIDKMGDQLMIATADQAFGLRSNNSPSANDGANAQGAGFSSLMKTKRIKVGGKKKTFIVKVL